MSGIRGIDEGPSDKEEKEKAAMNVVVSQDQHEQNPSSSSNSSSSSSRRQRQPKIAYIQPARIIRVNPSEFKALVQKLTAMPKEEPGVERELMTNNHPSSSSSSSTNPPPPPPSSVASPRAYCTEVPRDVSPYSLQSRAPFWNKWAEDFLLHGNVCDFSTELPPEDLNKKQNDQPWSVFSVTNNPSSSSSSSSNPLLAPATAVVALDTEVHDHLQPSTGGENVNPQSRDEEPQGNPSIEEDLDDDGNWWRWWWW